MPHSSRVAWVSEEIGFHSATNRRKVVSWSVTRLTVTGERQFERKDDRNYHRIERAYGTFTRSFTLPRSVDGTKIAANYTNGVLEIEIPKKEDSRPRQIQINVNKNQLEG